MLAYAVFPKDPHYHLVALQIGTPGGGRTLCGIATRPPDAGGRRRWAVVTRVKPPLSSHTSCPACDEERERGGGADEEKPPV